MELEDEVTSVQDEEVPADLDSQQEPKDLVDGEFDLAYLEPASSTKVKPNAYESCYTMLYYLDCKRTKS